jgi:hypothetical protein
LLFENNSKSLLPERNKQRELLHDYTIKGKESLRAAGRSPKGRRRRSGETNRKKKKKKHHEHAVCVSTISNNWFRRKKKTERKLEEEAQSL